MELNSKTIEYLKNKVSVLDIISPYVKLEKRGNRYFACCPFHNEKTPSFTVDTMRNRYHCFGCGASGDSINFLMEYNNLSFVDAVKELASKAGVQLTFNEKQSNDYKQKNKERDDLYEIMQTANGFFVNNLKTNSNALSYVKSRFLSQDDCLNFELGYSLNSFSALLNHLTAKGYSKESIIKCGLALEKNGNFYDMFRNRIMFPIKNNQGKIVAFGARSFDGSSPKYINSKETVLFSKKNNLYGLFNALKQGVKFKKDYIIITEGYLDVIKLHKYGFINSVAPLGTALTENHLSILSRFSSNHVLCFDGDQAGLKAALKTALIYLKYSHLEATAKFIILPNGKDPDDYLEQEGAKKFLELVNNASTLFEFLWQVESEGKNLKNPDLAIAVEKKLKSYFKDISDINVKRIYNNELEKRTRGQNTNRSQYYNNKKNPLTSASKVSKQRHDKIKEKILLAYLLKHPYLLDEYNETLCRVKLEDSLNITIFNDILSINLNEYDESQELKDFFANKDYYNYIESEVFSNRVLELEPQIESNYSEDTVSSFKGVLESFAKKKLKEETDKAYKEFLQEGLEKKSNTKERFINLKNLQN